MATRVKLSNAREAEEYLLQMVSVLNRPRPLIWFLGKSSKAWKIVNFCVDFSSWIITVEFMRWCIVSALGLTGLKVFSTVSKIKKLVISKVKELPMVSSVSKIRALPMISLVGKIRELPMIDTVGKVRELPMIDTVSKIRELLVIYPVRTRRELSGNSMTIFLIWSRKDIAAS